ncbi:MAG: PQQ-like beta-propeller repeat protein [Candidatus Marinimicrobia bacterium]|nr:PQQ-like beta-propeller repeat protein [Candidatus Neomarinimicrobiota bacterium]
MNYLFTKIFISFTIILCIGCTEDPPNTNGDDNNNTIPTTMPQEHIPWPSLADSPWPMYRHDPQGTGRSQYVGPQLGEIKWTLPFSPGIVSGVGITSFAIGPDSTLYFGSSFERPEGSGATWVFYAVAPDGSVKWTFRDTTKRTHDYMERAPLVTANTTIIFSVPDGTEGDIYALRPDGTLWWKFHVDGQPSELNIGLDGTLYFIASRPYPIRDDLYALTLDGQLKWRLQADNEFNGYGIAGIAISPDGQTLYVGGRSGYRPLYALDTNGGIRWTFFSGDSNASVHARPIVDNQGNIYCALGGSYQAPADPSATGLYSLSPQGEVRWKKGRGGMDNEAYTIDQDGNLYIMRSVYLDGTWGEQLHALNYAGRERWIIAATAYHTFTPLVCDVEGILFTVGAAVVAISGQDGTTIWQLPLPHNSSQSPVLGADGTLYLGFSGGEGNKYVYAVH